MTRVYRKRNNSRTMKQKRGNRKSQKKVRKTKSKRRFNKTKRGGSSKLPSLSGKETYDEKR